MFPKFNMKLLRTVFYSWQQRHINFWCDCECESIFEIVDESLVQNLSQIFHEFVMYIGEHLASASQETPVGL